MSLLVTEAGSHLVSGFFKDQVSLAWAHATCGPSGWAEAEGSSARELLESGGIQAMGQRPVQASQHPWGKYSRHTHDISGQVHGDSVWSHATVLCEWHVSPETRIRQLYFPPARR